jgi:hypothetical protein
LPKSPKMLRQSSCNPLLRSVLLSPPFRRPNPPAVRIVCTVSVRPGNWLRCSPGPSSRLVEAAQSQIVKDHPHSYCMNAAHFALSPTPLPRCPTSSQLIPDLCGVQRVCGTGTLACAPSTPGSPRRAGFARLGVEVPSPALPSSSGTAALGCAPMLRFPGPPTSPVLARRGGD